MQQNRETKIADAVRQCGERCLQATSISGEIHAFFADLEASGEWTEAELQDVEEGILAAMFGLLNCALYPGDAKHEPVREAERFAVEAVC
jgi:hypothetical protein